MSKKNVTFNDIAKYTGFSKTTISRYFNNPESLTLHNKQIIADALEALNYQENKVARIFASGKSGFVGIIIPTLYFHFFANMLDSILSTQDSNGYKFLVFISNGDADAERKYINELLSYKVEGLIVFSHQISSYELRSYDIPIVTIEREDMATSSVNTDNYLGGHIATEYLIKNKCDVLIHINEQVPENIPSFGRIQAFKDVCKKNDMTHEIFQRDLGTDNDTTTVVMEDILDSIISKYPNQKKGIFVSDDTRASFLLNVIMRKFKKLPKDISIIGFDDTLASRNAVYPISTIRQDIDSIVNKALSILIQQMEGRKKKEPDILHTPIHEVIAPMLVKRET